MSADVPNVNRFNSWGEWRPFMFSSMEDLQAFQRECRDASADPDLSAALAYARATRHEGIEFVLLSNYWDARRFRTYAQGVTLVRLWDPPPEPNPRPFICVYDGWIPVADSSVESLRAALRTLQDTFDFFAYQYGVPLRTFVKYRECYQRAEWRDTDDEADARFRDRLTRLHDLPEPIRTAVLRCTHWHQSGTRQAKASDRFLGLWLAFESLALVLYESSGLLHLPLPGETTPLTKRQRKSARDVLTQKVLDERALEPPSDRVSAAYFEGVVGVRRRVETVLLAMLGDDERIEWLYQRNGPAAIRGKLVHEGWSEADVTQARDLDDWCRRLGLLVKELVERVLLRSWATPLELPRNTYTAFLDPMNVIGAGTGWEFKGDFTISLPMLAHKRVLRF